MDIMAFQGQLFHSSSRFARKCLLYKRLVTSLSVTACTLQPHITVVDLSQCERYVLWLLLIQVQYSSPVSPQLYGPLAAILVAAGLGFMSMSFVQQMKANRAEQSIAKDLPLVVTSSTFLGFGALFLLLWSGVHV